ncbi:MAG: NAD+ synthase [Candidatus Thorarchaeota archaeon]|jgi:NAD+ synthase
MDLPEGLRLDDYDKPREIIVDFIKTYVTRVGVEGLVLGLSGGIDSSLVAALACEAIGPDRVLGIMLPVDAKIDAKNVADAQELAESLEMKHEVFELKDAVSAYNTLSLEKVALGNLTARLRMVTWYARANQENRLVLGTGNKSELMVGYFTKYGDGGSDMLPIGELYKTNVWDLSTHIGLPKTIVEKVPSAGLWKSQTDEGELGVTYRELDSILFLHLEKGLEEEEIISWGISESKVSRVMKLMSQSEHKRKLLPRPSVR